jgi:hypothetical protein
MLFALLQLVIDEGRYDDCSRSAGSGHATRGLSRHAIGTGQNSVKFGSLNDRRQAPLALRHPHHQPLDVVLLRNGDQLIHYSAN